MLKTKWSFLFKALKKSKFISLSISSVTYLVFFSCAGAQTQGLIHSRLVLYRRAIFLAPL
jgi:hypothetical protein